MAEQYPRGLCCHEAGHAIVAYSFNLHVESVYVRFEEAKGWYGCAKTSSPEYLSISDQVVNSAAGKAAEEYFNCPAHEGAWLHDFGEISSLLNRSGLPDDELWPRIGEGIERARDILKKYRNEALMLTNRLAECGRIDGIEFTRLMNARRMQQSGSSIDQAAERRDQFVEGGRLGGRK
jgi:Zn-finger nucleic acid-binding protein